MARRQRSRWALLYDGEEGGPLQGTAPSLRGVGRRAAPSRAPPRACEGWGGGGPFSAGLEGLERRVVGVALRAVGVEEVRLRLVLRVLAGPPLDQVGVGDGGAAHRDGLGVRGLDQTHRLVARGDRAE